MIEVSAWSRPIAVAARELSYAETSDLDRLRAVLATTCDRTDPRAVSWLWDSMVAAHRGPAPAGFVEAIATALGDLLAVHVPGVRWAVWPGPAGPTLGVASHARPQAPVVPFLDAQDRWDAGARDWIAEYLAGAAAHLAGVAVPQQRPAPGDEAAPTAVAQTPQAADDETASVYEPAPALPARPPLPTRVAAPVADVLPISLPVATPAPARDQFVAPPAAAPPPATLLTRAAPETFAPAAPEALAPQAQETPAPTPAFATPLEDFALDALDHAMALLRETGAFDREVFAMLLDADGALRTESCPGDPREARFRARELVRSSGAVRAAITFIERDPADLPGPRQTFPAVVVDAWDAGSGGVRVARRFVDDVLGTGPLGPPLVVGHVARLL